MIRTVPLSIISDLALCKQQWYISYRFADSLRAGSGRNCKQAVRKPVCSLLHSPATSSLLGVNILHNTMFSKNLSFLSSSNVSDQVSTHTKQQAKPDALNSQIYFWNKTLHVSNSSSVHHQEFFTVHTAMV